MVKISVDWSALEQEKPSELRKYLDLTVSEAFKMQLGPFLTSLWQQKHHRSLLLTDHVNISVILLHIYWCLVFGCLVSTSHFYFYQKENQTAGFLHQTEELNLDLTGTGRPSIFSLTGQYTETILYFQSTVGVRWGRQESRWVGDSHTHTYTP